MQCCKVHALDGILMLLFVPVLLGQMFSCGQRSVEEYREEKLLWLKVCVLDSWFEGEFHQINLLSESCYATFVF